MNQSNGVWAGLGNLFSKRCKTELNDQAAARDGGETSGGTA